jgi:predicted HAD superfamily phosphohydrolase YqeG
MPSDWVTTLQQTVPRLRRTVRAGHPDFELPDIRAVSRAFLEQHGIVLVLWDVDGTLMAYHANAVAPEFHGHLEGLFRDTSLTHVILSNCGERRFVELGSILPGMTLARAYSTKSGPVLRLRTGDRDSHSDEEVRQLLAGGARIIRKPSPVPFQLVLAEIGNVEPSAALMVGDQHLTDVAGANQAGIRSAKVATYRPDSFPLILRAGQQVERVLVRVGR